MVGKLVTKIFGSKHGRDIKRMQPIVDQINQAYEQIENLSDDELKGKTQDFKDRIESATKEVVTE